MILVIDNFIKDQDLLNRISNDNSFFTDPGNYYWWDGWWNSEANTLKKELIQYIWADNCPISQIFNISGFEYWTGVQSADPNSGFENNLIMHKDKDEAYWDKTGEIVSPMIGTIYYPEQEEFTGGMLEIYTNGQNEEPERIYAKSNRLIIFDAGTVFHRVDTVTSGTRKAIAINLWEGTPYSKQIGTFAIEQ